MSPVFLSYFGLLWLTGFRFAGFSCFRWWSIWCCCSSFFVCRRSYLRKAVPVVFLLLLVLLMPCCIAFVRVDGFSFSRFLSSTVVALSCRRFIGSWLCGVAGTEPVICLARLRRRSQLEFVFPCETGELVLVTPGFSVFVSRRCSTCILLLHFYAGLQTHWLFCLLLVVCWTTFSMVTFPSFLFLALYWKCCL